MVRGTTEAPPMASACSRQSPLGLSRAGGGPGGCRACVAEGRTQRLGLHVGRWPSHMNGAWPNERTHNTFLRQNTIWSTGAQRWLRMRRGDEEHALGGVQVRLCYL